MNGTAATTTDADGNVTLTFTDVLGRTVLVRRLTDSYSYADTYTISDSWGNPLVVLPPEASAAIGDWECPTDGEPIDLYAYLYTYDAALRLAAAHEQWQGMKVIVVKQSDVFNEYSSGALHPNGLRHFVKQLASSSVRPLR